MKPLKTLALTLSICAGSAACAEPKAPDFKSALSCTREIEFKAVWHEIDILNTRYESSTVECVNKLGHHSSIKNAYYVINLGSNGQSNGTYTSYTVQGNELRSDEQDFILRRTQYAKNVDWHQFACRFDDISAKGYGISERGYLFGVNKANNVLQLVMDNDGCDGKVIASFEQVDVRDSQKYDHDLAIQYFTKQVPLPKGDYYSVGCRISGRTSSNRPCSKQTNTDVKLGQASQDSASAGELIKDAEGGTMIVNQYEAISVCDRLGLRLPTIREVLQSEVKNGIVLLETANYDADQIPPGYVKRDFAKVSETNDQFYYSNKNYKVATRETGTNSVWSSFVDTRPGYGWGFMFNGFSGNISYVYRDIVRAALRCVAR